MYSLIHSSWSRRPIRFSSTRKLSRVAGLWAAVLMVGVSAFIGDSACATEGFEGWHLEPGVGQAHLVMVARVASISRVTVVEGAKTEVALREFRFQPVRRLKGIFQRDQLSMTPSDLGISGNDASLAPPLKEGEYRLLILVQPQGLTSYGCVSAAPGATTFAERVPLLSGPDDPLVAVVETLIQVADSRSRRERASLLVDRLAETDGVAAVPLLSSLQLRADWAAAEPRAYAALARLAGEGSTAVRAGALEVLREMLATGTTSPRHLEGVAEALHKVLKSDEGVTHVRLAALQALGHLLALDADLDWPRDLLVEQLTGAATHAERAAAATALGQVSDPRGITAVHDALAGLPLDEPAARESLFARAAVRLDSARAEEILLTRLERSIAARQSLEAEVVVLGRMQSKESLPVLLAALGQLRPGIAAEWWARHPHLEPRSRQDFVSASDRQHIAWALGQLGEDSVVHVLIGWLRGDNHQLKELALAALENIDSEVAAREARPLLKSESHLPFKLRIARLLARHGFDDGYALATEHLADQQHTAAAALVLAALDDPRTSQDLSAILAARPDRRWHAAVLTGLVAIGDADARKQLLDILTDDRHPLAADAAEAAGLGADSELLLPLATLVRSRNKQIAMASLVALRRYLSGVRSSPRGLAAVNLTAADRKKTDFDDGELVAPAADMPAKTRAALADAVASLVLDAYVEADVRREAFEVVRLLSLSTNADDSQFAELLAELADQAELEGTPLLLKVKAERAKFRPADDHFVQQP